MFDGHVSLISCIFSVAMFLVLWTHYATCQNESTPGCWSGNTPLKIGQRSKVSNCSSALPAMLLGFN